MVSTSSLQVRPVESSKLNQRQGAGIAQSLSKPLGDFTNLHRCSILLGPDLDDDDGIVPAAMSIGELYNPATLSHEGGTKLLDFGLAKVAPTGVGRNRG